MGPCSPHRRWQGWTYVIRISEIWSYEVPSRSIYGVWKNGVKYMNPIIGLGILYFRVILTYTIWL